MITEKEMYQEWMAAINLARIDQRNRLFGGIDKEYQDPTNEQIGKKLVEVICNKDFHKIIRR